MDFLVRLIDTAFSDPIAALFCWVIIGALGLGLLLQLSQRWRSTRLANLLPTLMATTGLLGTFVGILVGLLDFDVTDIDASVPHLLAGLKVAFITSIAGIAGSIILRLAASAIPRSSSTDGVSPEDIHQVLEAIRTDAANQSATAQTHLAAIRDAIAAEGDGSLLSQIQKLRTEQRDGQSELIDEFRSFAKHMAENNQKALIEALNEIIRDFNQNLTEQFGENFKELNTAVHKLVEWQEAYREHVEGLEQRLDTAVAGVERAEAALREIEQHTRSIPENTKALEPVLAGLKSQTHELEQHMEALAALREQALQAFPVIEANLSNLTDKMSSHVKEAIDKTTESLQRHSESYKILESGFSELQKQAADSQAVFVSEMSKSLEAVNAHLTQSAQKHGKMIEAAANDSQKIISEAWEKTGTAIDKRMEDLDDQMQQELKRAIDALGTRLAAVSEKLVHDYGPLADRLDQVVQIAARVRA